MAGLDDARGKARDKGVEALDDLRRRLVEKAASLLREHPELAGDATEVGLVDKAWLEDPANRPIRTAAPLDVVQRFLERSVERDPSIVASLGLNAIQMLTLDHEVRQGGEQHDATVVFTDLEGFTSYTTRAGDVAARELLVRHHRAVGPVIRSRGGQLVKKIGDGLLMTFASPEAAVLAALEIEEQHDSDLRLRAGIHTGEVMMTGDDVIGATVNLAARVTDSARGGEVLATTQVRAAVGELRGVTFGRARHRRFKGVDGSVLVCPVRRAA